MLVNEFVALLITLRLKQAHNHHLHGHRAGSATTTMPTNRWLGRLPAAIAARVQATLGADVTTCNSVPGDTDDCSYLCVSSLLIEALASTAPSQREFARIFARIAHRVPSSKLDLSRLATILLPIASVADARKRASCTAALNASAASAGSEGAAVVSALRRIASALCPDADADECRAPHTPTLVGSVAALVAVLPLRTLIVTVDGDDVCLCYAGDEGRPFAGALIVLEGHMSWLSPAVKTIANAATSLGSEGPSCDQLFRQVEVQSLPRLRAGGCGGSTLREDREDSAPLPAAINAANAVGSAPALAGAAQRSVLDSPVTRAVSLEFLKGELKRLLANGPYSWVRRRRLLP